MWQTKFNFPSAIGAVDCTHIGIKKPHIHGDEYVNRKNFCSYNVQATCNANEVFTSMDCSWPGSVHDSRTWRNSECANIMRENGAQALLLADEGYGLTPWLMIPYKQPMTMAHRAYNKLLRKERSIIEKVFGQVKQRFLILQCKIRLATERIPSFIAACFVLHNIAKHLNDNDFPELELAPVIFPENYADDGSINQRGVARRNELTTIISRMPL